MTESRTLDADSPVPLYRQLTSQLIAGIRAGRWPPDTALPSERDLTRELAVSRATVRKAIDELVGEGLVVRRHGSGTFVAPDRGRRKSPEGDRADADTTLLSARIEKASKRVARALGLERGSRVAVITRLHRSDGNKLAVERSHLPHALFPDLLEQDLTGPLSGLLSDHYRLDLRGGDETVAFARTKKWIAKALGGKKKHPLLCAERIVRDHDGRALELSRRWARADRCSYRVQLAGGTQGQFVLRARTD